MSRHVHRAPKPARRPVRTLTSRVLPALLGALVVVGLVATLVGTFGISTNGDDVEAADVSHPLPVASESPQPEDQARTPTSRSRTARTAPDAVSASTTPRLEDARVLVKKAEQKAKQRARAKAERVAKLLAQPFELRIGTFNVLGSQHTAPGGDRRRYPPASVRSPAAASVIARHGVEILGTQELQSDQLAALQSRTGMAAYPGTGWGTAETDNSILYDASRFEFVSGSSFNIPFMGRSRPQPILRLKEKATGRELYVVNTHPSAGGGRYLSERRSGEATLVGIVNELKKSGLPVLVTGDMNDRQDFYCNVVPQAGLTAPNGGSYSSGCRPPTGTVPVDWVVGSGVTWSDYWRDTSPQANRTSDHFFISATAHVG